VIFTNHVTKEAIIYAAFIRTLMHRFVKVMKKERPEMNDGN
jgi:hypothetical protein